MHFFIDIFFFYKFTAFEVVSVRVDLASWEFKLHSNNFYTNNKNSLASALCTVINFFKLFFFKKKDLEMNLKTVIYFSLPSIIATSIIPFSVCVLTTKHKTLQDLSLITECCAREEKILHRKIVLNSRCHALKEKKKYRHHQTTYGISWS